LTIVLHDIILQIACFFLGVGAMPKWSLVLGFTARIAQISLSSKIQAKGRAVGETVDV